MSYLHNHTSIFDLQHCLGTLVPTLDINITSDGGSPFIAGQSYNLTCTVTLENVIGAPTVGWLDPTNNPLDNNSDTTVGETVPVNCFTYTTTLHFTTLRTSHGGQYSCQATLGAINNTAAINITAAVNITVLSKRILLLCRNGSGLSFFSPYYSNNYPFNAIVHTVHKLATNSLFPTFTIDYAQPHSIM